METAKNIYELELHESLMIGVEMKVVRVPGGWVYVMYANTSPSVFVPFNDEYSKNKKPKQPEYDDYTPDGLPW